MKLAGKVALVTGGARGLGRAYVLHLARLGCDIVINDVDLNSAAEFGEELSAPSVAQEVEAVGRRALGVEADVTDRGAVEVMIERTLQTFGRVDILVNNAGGNLRSHNEQSASAASPEHYQYIMDVNLTGTIFCCQAVSEPMRTSGNGGRIDNVPGSTGRFFSGDA